MTSARARLNHDLFAVVRFEGTYDPLFYALSAQEAMAAIGGGATMGNVKQDQSRASKPEAAMPLLREFHDFCTPLFQQTQLLSVQNLLELPATCWLRSISGDIAV